MDAVAAVTETIVLAPGERFPVPLGFCMAIPDGYEVQVRPRSGLALKHGITLPNSPGTIDSDYRGEVGVILLNAGAEVFRVAHGDRIAQMVVAPVVRAAFEMKARGKTSEAIQRLLGLEPKTARVIRNFQESDLPISEIKSGETEISHSSSHFTSFLMSKV